MKNVIFVFLSAIFISLGANLMSQWGFTVPSCDELKKQCDESNDAASGACNQHRTRCLGSNAVVEHTEPID